VIRLHQRAFSYTSATATPSTCYSTPKSMCSPVRVYRAQQLRMRDANFSNTRLSSYNVSIDNMGKR